MSERNSQWGRPLNLYAISYDVAAAKKRETLDSRTATEARDAINRICQLGAQVHQVNHNGETDEITLAMLEAVLKLALSPQTFRNFASPPLISGCIKLMALVKVSGKISPFSYEYGYLCFRIIAIALSVSLIERIQLLDMMTDEMMDDPETELLVTLTRYASAALASVLEATEDERDSDWLLGWIKSPHHPQQPFLVQRADTSSLLHVIWEDRKAFLKALVSTYLPGLSPVLFILWRYVSVECTLKNHPSPKLLAAPLCEILWRYMFVATTNQSPVLIHINNGLNATNLSEAWESSPKISDLEDSRTMLKAFIARLSAVDSLSYRPLAGAAIPIFMKFVTPVIQPGTEDLVPSLLELALHRFWALLIGRQKEKIPLPYSIGAALHYIGQIFESLRQTFHSNQRALVRVLETMFRNDILDLIGRAIFLLKPSRDESSTEFQSNARFLDDTQSMFLELSKVVPQGLLEYHFRHYARDWLKYRNHFIILTDGSAEPFLHSDVIHFQFCREVWNSIAQLLGLVGAVEQARKIIFQCDYARCANPERLEGTRLACSRCREVAYCSSRCQALDWITGGERGSHRELCRGHFPVLTPPDLMAREAQQRAQLAL